MVPNNLQTLITDKYSTEDLLEKLASTSLITTDAILDIFGEEIMEEFCDGGVFEDEWRELFNGLS